MKRRSIHGRSCDGICDRRALVSLALLAVIALLIVACRDDATAQVGDTVGVGDLDLTLVEFEVLETGSYSLLSEANARARLRAINVRGRSGEVYRFAPYAAFRLDDSSGVGRGPRLCPGCEDLVDAVELGPGAEIVGWLYFHLKEGEDAKMLRYSAPQSRNRVEFSVD